MLVVGALLTVTQIQAQAEPKMDLIIEVNESTFKNYKDGFCQVAFELSPSADLIGLKKMVAENPQYFQIKTQGYNVTLGWAIWRKVFVQADIHVIQVIQNNQSHVVDEDGFMNMFGFENIKK